MLEWIPIRVDDPNMFLFTGPVATREYELRGHRSADGMWDCCLFRCDLDHSGQRVEPDQGQVVDDDFTARDPEGAKRAAEALIEETRY